MSTDIPEATLASSYLDLVGGAAVPVSLSPPSSITPDPSLLQPRSEVIHSLKPASLQPAEMPFELDRASPLDPFSFPNPPRKAGLSIAATIANVVHLLDRYRITVRYDVIAKKFLIVLPGHSGTMDNYDDVAMTALISLAELNNIAAARIPTVIAAIGDRNQFNPVLDWINSKPWDGVTRIPDILATLVEQEHFPRALKDTLVRRWLLSAAAAIVKSEGFRARGVLTLQGPQGIGKTQWIRALISDPALRQRVIKTDHCMDGTKDALLGAIRHWLVELGEVEGSLRKDIAKLKGAITADQDKVRVPYGRIESEFQRRTVFAATVNDKEFLIDSTGNTRFWTVPLASIDHRHTIDTQQLFSELANLVLSGEQWWLKDAEEADLEMQNLQHRTVSVVRERVAAAIDTVRIGQAGLAAMTATQVLQAIGIKDPTNPQAKDCAVTLREIVGESKRLNGRDVWRVPFAEGIDTLNVAIERPFREPTDEDF